MTKIYLSRKRTVIRDKKKFFRFIFLSVLALNFIIFGLISPAATNANEDAEPITVTVKSGDTLWSIAEEYCEDGDVRDLVYEIKKENSLSNANLYVGQKLTVPVN